MAREPATAESQLERLLYILPAAAGEDGCALADLAASLGVPAEQVLRDLGEVTARQYYHPAGGAENLQILVEGERVSVWTTGELRRPTRLGPREAFCLGLGLRVLAAEAGDGERDRLLGLAARLEAELASVPPEELPPRHEVDAGRGADAGVRMLLKDAARERRSCRIRYLKPGAEAPEERMVDPYTLVFGEGVWYMLARCRAAGEMRVFRLDRVLEACPAGDGFDVPEDFDPDAYVRSDGRVFRADEEVRVPVRYSPRVARWVVERTGAEPEADGSVVIEHQVADVGWLLRHVLQYGPDAEVLGPEEVREAAAREAEALARAE